MEDNAQYVIMGEWKVPQHRNISIDELVEFFAPLAQEKSPYPLRRIEVYDPKKDEILVFLTNHLD